ncbi:uncharacterized protein RAG0_05201 [Rhynchosporium agropyri]|uniref:Uncharacterized protein n=1 Tax=Rhynchosporium agropyri TaxID=914238 RepID=A0A1E1KCB6_9HELO|nr:uncharacterized protein RAG0_05201 [Rhynchosporium agropyri]
MEMYFRWQVVSRMKPISATWRSDDLAGGNKSKRKRPPRDSRVSLGHVCGFGSASASMRILAGSRSDHSDCRGKSWGFNVATGP